jgi:hypothetical protein
MNIDADTSYGVGNVCLPSRVIFPFLEGKRLIKPFSLGRKKGYSLYENG